MFFSLYVHVDFTGIELSLYDISYNKLKILKYWNLLSYVQSFFGFGTAVDIDIVLDGQETRKTAEIKAEDGKLETHYLYYDGETICGKVVEAPHCRLFCSPLPLHTRYLLYSLHYLIFWKCPEVVIICCKMITSWSLVCSAISANGR